MLNKYLTRVFFGICLLMMTMTVYATPPSPIKLPINLGSCGLPSEHIMRCMSQWACQHAIRLDLRCLLNLNGTPLLGGLLGGTGLAPSAGGASGGGGVTSLLGGLLGR